MDFERRIEEHKKTTQELIQYIRQNGESFLNVAFKKLKNDKRVSDILCVVISWAIAEVLLLADTSRSTSKLRQTARRDQITARVMEIFRAEGPDIIGKCCEETKELYPNDPGMRMLAAWGSTEIGLMVLEEMESGEQETENQET